MKICDIISKAGGRSSVARAMGLPYSTVHYWYTTNRVPNRNHASTLAKLAGVEFASVWHDKGTAAERRRWHVETAIHELSRVAAGEGDPFRCAELMRTAAGLRTVLEFLAPETRRVVERVAGEAELC